MKKIKKLLFKLLSQQQYLSLLHTTFYLLYDLNLLKNDARYKYHYAVKQLIKPSDTVVDIGANLGYFAKNFARLTPQGKVICIEPVPHFYTILSKKLSRFPQVELHNVALGNASGSITMAFPESDGMIRTGLPHILRNEADKARFKTQEVQVVKGTDLLKNLTKIDYIKCDIEGYEAVVFNEIRPLLSTFMPIVQLELDEKNKIEMLSFFSNLNYVQFGIAGGKLIKEEGEQKEQGDYLFVPATKLDRLTAMC
jgi:FkbM family methyltransferase